MTRTEMIEALDVALGKYIADIHNDCYIDGAIEAANRDLGYGWKWSDLSTKQQSIALEYEEAFVLIARVIKQLKDEQKLADYARDVNSIAAQGR